MQLMNTQLHILAATIILGLVYVMLAGLLATRIRGLAWNAGNRDGTAQPLDGPAARAERASRNFLETFPFFAASVLAVELFKTDDGHVLLGSQIYFWARVAYLPIYVIGIPYLRTLVWALSFWGILQNVEALF
jgi:uncharacterized MAPEG superfamily protein